MEFKKVRSVIELLVLLCLLFWSFNWNIPSNYDISEPRKSLKSVPGKSQFDSEEKGYRSNIVESFKTVKYVGSHDWKVSLAGDSLLPPFNAWKEEELNKQERNEMQNKIAMSRTSRRRLNYASSKCGAKILASNKESKHRMSILNEKIDEYMLNPCRIKAWFVIELCDTIEATQIELANYELYSSSPKEFSVFWSNIFPTQKWYPLGTFEAKDQRSMQTFNLDFRNSGKFVKVIISSHHGKEHYCPLSVFRVIGYSMVYEYDNIEDEEESDLDKNKSQINETEFTNSTEITPSPSIENSNDSSNERLKNDMEREWHSKVNSLLLKSCQQMQKYCSISESTTKCFNQPTCLFLKRIALPRNFDCNYIWTSKTSCHNLSSVHYSVTENSNLIEKSFEHVENNTFNKKNLTENEIRKRRTELPSCEKLTTSFKKINFNSFNSSNEIKRNAIPDNSKVLKINESDNSENYDSFNNSKLPFINNASKTDYKSSKLGSNLKPKEGITDSNKHCDCTKAESIVEPSKESIHSSEPPQFEIMEHDTTDSAALIQKESVLVKLTMRIKASETNLNLINRYLQQLSESYRKHMEDMLSMFNGTVRAIRVTSEKVAVSDRQQQTTIEQLQLTVKLLNSKVQHLETGQSDIIKKVLELHGFFLILEFIVMSTIFSIFFNKFRHNSIYTNKRYLL